MGEGANRSRSNGRLILTLLVSNRTLEGDVGEAKDRIFEP